MNRILLSIAALLSAALIAAQAPQSFDFQGVARDAGGQLLSSQSIALRISILAGSPSGTVAYQETHVVTTSPFGLFTVAIGAGTPTQGSFPSIGWGASSHFIQVELDASGGSSFTDMGTTQLLSVPYALHARAVDCFAVSLLGDTLKQGNGCFVIIPGISIANGGCKDLDGDGVYDHIGCSDPVDCDDNDPTVYPGAPEICGDGKDNDCDGEIDNNPDVLAHAPWYQDSDGDGFGDAAVSQLACVQPTGYVDNDEDCDDNDPSRFPGQGCSLVCSQAEQTWIDQNLGDYLNQVFLIWANCFGSDPNCVEQQLIELEQTGEVPLSLACHSCAITYVQCIQSTCLTACIGNPLGAGCQQCIATSCRPAFLNCAGLIDEDGDGWSTGSDCNDSDPNIYPGAPEPCDGNDNDCDGEVDEGAIVTWYLDQDGDGYGAGTGTADCDAPGPNYTDNDFDCDDNDPAVFPGQGCAGFDCGFYYGTDQGTCGQGTFCDNGVCVPCQDLDGDGFFDCDGDCDDNNPDVYPGSPELCDGLDNDCNGAVDEFFTWYEDSDGDGFGNTVTATFNCEQPVGFVSVSGDCNDEDPAIYPLAGPGLGCVSCSVDDRNWIQDNYLNLWNTTGQVVQDCEGLSGQDLWNCLAAQLTSLTPIATSCLQCVVERAYCAATTCGSACIPFLLGSNEVVGGSPECVQCMVANGCHSTFAACVGLVDMDGDGAQASQDCNDNNAAIYPGAPEPCNGVDHDCDGQVAPQCQCAVGQVEVCGSSIGQCQPGTRTCLEGGIWSSCVGEVPPAPEICNGIDDDCDGATDEDPVSGPIWYRDADLDGFGTPSNTVIACSPPFGYVSNSLDCDDTNAAINPAAPEACNGIDDNCNGMSDEGFNTQDDSQNCGACGIVCPPGATCVNGQCVE